MTNPLEGWESLPYASLCDLEDEGDFNKLRRVWKETKKGGFFTVRKEYYQRTGGVGSIKVTTFDAFPSEDRVVELRLEERYDPLAHAQSTFPRAQTHYQVVAELL